MAERWYLAPVLAPVPESTPGAGDAKPQRLAVDDILIGLPHASSCVIPTHTFTGVALFDWGLAVVDGPNGTHSSLGADNRLFALPDMLLDAPLSTQPGNIRNALLNRLAAHGVNTTGLTQASTLRDVIVRVGQHLDGGQFTVDHHRARGP